MENKVVAFNPRNGMNAKAHRKEKAFTHSYELLGIDTDGKIRNYASLRIYQPNTVAYACFWLFAADGPIPCNGSGKAGGHGYDKPSAAASNAFDAAGIKLAQDIDGRGSSAIEAALLAIAEHFAIKNPYVHNAHG